MVEGSTSQENENPNTISMYRHIKMGDWGLASVDWERDGKRAYRFQDGTVRVFAERFYHLFEKVGEMEVSPNDPKSGVTMRPNLDDQLRLFLERYPDGFAGEAYIKKHRGGKGRRLKRHRVGAIQEAQEKLSPEALDTMIGEGRFQDVIDTVVAVLESTDLATKSHLDGVRRVMATEGVAQAVKFFLYSDEDELSKFAKIRRELGAAGLKSPAWNVITGIRSLVHPSKHVCVRPSSFDAEGQILRRTFKTQKQPNVGDYGKYLELATDVRDGLRDRGYPPEDFFDVYDFVCATMRPAEREALDAFAAERHEAEMRSRAAAAKEAMEEKQAAEAAANEAVAGEAEPPADAGEGKDKQATGETA